MVGIAATEISSLPYLSFAPSLNALGIVDITANAGSHNCVLFANGSVVCFGKNSNGQLGTLSTANHQGDFFGEMAALTPVVFGATITFQVVQVVAGLQNSCVLFVQGRILCWGANNSGQLGIDSTVDMDSPALIAAATYIVFSDSVPAVQISIYAQTICSLFANSRVRCWGDNLQQQLGENTSSTVSRGIGANPISGAVFITFSLSINSLNIIGLSVGK